LVCARAALAVRRIVSWSVGCQLRGNNFLILVVALVMGGIAAFLARDYIQSQAHPVSGLTTAVVAAVPLSFGTVITRDNVVEIAWPGGALPDSVFKSKEELFKDGSRRALVAMERNEPILRTKVTGPGQRASLSSKLEDGKRAVTVRVDDVRGVAGFILPDDRVDVVLIRPERGSSNNSSYSDILLQYVKVLAVDQLANEQREQPTVAKAVTLEVTPEEAQKVILATDLGKLSLILRQQGEAGLEASRRVTERDLGQAPALPERVVATAAPGPPANVAVSVGVTRYEVPRMK
jgi:pilus assembly protein CpaB